MGFASLRKPRQPFSN